MSGRLVTLPTMRTTRISGELRMQNSRRFTPFRLAVAFAASSALALGISSCVKVASYTQPSLVRFIDASYTAPAANVLVEGQLIAANSGAGTITPYGTVPANIAALIQISPASGGAALVTTNGTLLPGHQHSVFLTDSGAAPSSYTVTILEDQPVHAASNLSAFRFLNQAPKTGAVDIYMVPAGVALADAIPLVADLRRWSHGKLCEFHLAECHHGRYADGSHQAGIHLDANHAYRR